MSSLVLIEASRMVKLPVIKVVCGIRTSILSFCKMPGKQVYFPSRVWAMAFPVLILFCGETSEIQTAQRGWKWSGGSLKYFGYTREVDIFGSF